jgi:hypothetical protein
MNEMEMCQRCKREGSDRRTLWMACFYEMLELGLPFELREQGAHTFYTLRVCKDCRADWMRAIQAWFKDAPSRDDEDGLEEGAVYVRDFGATRKMTPAD